MANQTFDKLKKVDWKGPVAILTIGVILLGIYAGGHYMKMGLFLGCAMSLGILILIGKSPISAQKWMHRHALLSDLVFSAFVTLSVSALFGSGLTLGIGAISSAVILSWAIPAVTEPAVLGVTR